ncbi:Uncharacterized protein Fot_36133 [Forsythia ovata]|uniref:Uncharacterized protein n=1 Tax=Forsythia ovata TaxID=205694 RepID=A0ABD1SNJ6_9LAMI
MADVLNHGGDGGDEPLHEHANRLQADCQTDTAARRYRQYKANVNAYIRDKGTAVPYRGLTAVVWEKCIERSSSEAAALQLRQVLTLSLFNFLDLTPGEAAALQLRQVLTLSLFNFLDLQTPGPALLSTDTIPIKVLA